MEKFEMINEVGGGAFGNVWRATNRQTGEVVAIKKLKKKYSSFEECMNLREVKCLRKMSHPNIVKLVEVIKELDILYFIFEYMECDLFQLIEKRDKIPMKLFSESEIRNWCFQIFQALAYMHQRGYFHRDLKPENLLCTKDIIKIADLGLAREVSSHPPYTQYVSTRWYRAPEVLLQSSIYGSAVDMWAMGAIMAEMFTLQPLFPGSSEADEVYKICSVIGTPNQNSWCDGLYLARVMNYEFPQFSSVDLSLLIPSASRDAISLISSLCSWDPCKRPTAVEALQHPFFQSCYYIPPSLRLRAAGVPTTTTSGCMRGVIEQKNNMLYSVGALSNSRLVDKFPSPKFDLEHKNSTIHSVGTSSDTRPVNYFPSPKVNVQQKNCMLYTHFPPSKVDLQQKTAKANTSLKTGLPRKFWFDDDQEPERDEQCVHNSMKQSLYRPPPRNNQASYIGRDTGMALSKETNKKLSDSARVNFVRVPQKMAHVNDAANTMGLDAQLKMRLSDVDEELALASAMSNNAQLSSVEAELAQLSEKIALVNASSEPPVVRQQQLYMPPQAPPSSVINNASLHSRTNFVGGGRRTYGMVPHGRRYKVAGW